MAKKLSKKKKSSKKKKVPKATTKKKVSKKKSVKKKTTKKKSAKKKTVPKDYTITKDVENKYIEYKLGPSSYQYPKIKVIKFHGFTSRPSGFNWQGRGMVAPAGSFLVNEFSERLGEKITLEIHKELDQPTITTHRNTPLVKISYPDYLSILNELREIRKLKNINSKDVVLNRLNNIFPSKFSAPDSEVATAFDYSEDKITRMFEGSDNIIESMSEKDVETILNMYPKIIKEKGIKGTNKKKMKISKENKSANEIIYLKSVIEEYEKKLQQSTQNESVWQKFLKENLLLFNTNHTQIIEKENISLDLRIPDFLMLDVYNYLDIFEIKKPNTALIKYDTSRKCYYWSTDMSMAVGQTENYINVLTQNSDAFRTKVKDAYDIDLKIVRPKGIIIVGHSDQLDTQPKKDGFRILADSLKNIDVILYDSYLDGIKNLKARLDN